MTVCAHSGCHCPGYPGQSVPSNANLKVVCRPTWLLWEPSITLPTQLRSDKKLLCKEVLKIIFMYHHIVISCRMPLFYSIKKKKSKK